MNFLLSETIIKRLCGYTAFKKGKTYYRAEKVNLLNYKEDSETIEASVKGGSVFRVTVKQDRKGDIKAECTCPTLASFDTCYCQHIAAVLLFIKDMQQQDDAPSQLADKMLGLFEKKATLPSGNLRHFETREMVKVKFICQPILMGNEDYLFGVQMQVGHEKTYIIQRLREFLDKIEQRQSYKCSEEFTYNPEIHSFQKETDEVIQLLINVSKTYSIHNENVSEEDMIFISHSNWEQFLPLLLAAPSVKIQHNGSSYSGMKLSNEMVPLAFEFKEAKSRGYQLDVKGLNQITVLQSYGYILSKGELIKLPLEDCKRLSELKQMLNHSGKHQLAIAVEQIDYFMETVTPGLMRIGHVQIAESISDRLIKTPLKAKLFLDRVKNKLLAGLEFHYGNLVVNPFEESGQAFRYNPTLIRQGDKEQLIMKLMEENAFTKTEGGFYIEDESAEYNFLYHVVPTLEKLVEIYATTAVKVRIHKGYVGPKISVNVGDRTDWLSFRFDIQGIPESEIRKILLSLKEKQKFYKMQNGSLVSLETKEFQTLAQFINEMGLHAEDINKEEIRLPLISSIQIIDSLQEGNLVTEGQSFCKLMENLHNPCGLDYAVPISLAPVLRDYQKVGFKWLKILAKYKFGGILADDMGLGKTIQSIAFIVSVLPEVRQRKLPVFIVCPSSLVYNWMNELKKFAPEIEALIVDGSKLRRSTILKDITSVDVIITSYPSLRMDSKLYLKQSFHTLFLDEAQAFKNHATQTARVVKRIRADYRFALTGTPIENSLEDLWSIFNVVFPKLLPRRTAFNELTRENVAKRVRPFILRRLKKDVLKELPDKIEKVQLSELNLEQKKLYAAYLAELKQDVLKHLNKDSFQKNRIKFLAGLTRLRQLCCHPALFVEGYKGGSAKFDQLMDIVEECRIARRRVLIFSQFTQMLDIIGRKLGYYGVPYFYLDGQTPPFERVALCDRFNEGEGNLFLISLKAGGTGLNLTGADTVVLYDLWWNPAVERQAADRAHRMGQKNEVHVIKLIARGTIEEKINELQQKKENLIGRVIKSSQESFATMTEQDIREILMV